MKRTIGILTALVCILTVLCLGAALAEIAATPTASPIPTPSPEELGKLTFRIDGPDPSMPVTVTYSEFTNGKYSLSDLVPGTYTVTEVDPDELLTGYVFDAQSSTQSVTIEVRADATATRKLTNVYELRVEVTPTPSPEPSETPTPTPTPTPTTTPTPEPDDYVDIPVIKVWDDMDNRDGSRPGHVIVHLLANGSRTEQAVLNEANGWSYTFTEMKKYAANGQEIVYTVTEDAVSMYTAEINGYTITNHYQPETTSASVSKVWADNDNEAGIRPLSIYCTLSNGITHVATVELNPGNGWSATVENLPVTVNGQQVTYTWKEQEIIGYTQTEAIADGNNAVFVNTLVERGSGETEDKPTPTKGRGNSYLIIEDYGTPLGVEVVINHVGDCYD